MLSNILTWVGAVLGIVVLLAMASGSVALDFADARGRRRGRDKPGTSPHGDPHPATDGVSASPQGGTAPPR
ncbi:hypothetical protein, partial [Saccharomonospora iraqiensis]|uniref:hypothetical protein n=1 Tax=Saccharomonospora iraqiensis TaxID=52698 RepID=UPI00022DFCE7